MKLILSGLAVAIFAVAAAPARAEVRAFQVALSSSATFSPDAADPCLTLVHEVGTGTSKAFGAMTWTDVEIANGCSVENGGLSVVAQFTLTRADGSKIFGTFKATGKPDADGVLSFRGAVELESGTGAFAGIRGAGIITAKGIQNTPDLRGNISGLYTL